MADHFTPAEIARIAADLFADRRRALKQAVANGDWPGDPANETAQLWLAIALAAGADLPADVREKIELRCTFPPGKRILPRPDQIAPPHAYLGELARARTAAITAAEAAPKDLRKAQRARDLIALADHLGAPGIDWSPKQERNAA